MEGSLVFNSAAFSAIDEWAGQKDTAAGAAEQHEDDHHPPQHQQQAQHGRWKRAGVGAVTAAKPKEAAAQLEATGSLQKLVMGHRSKKKRDREAAEAEVAAAAAAAEAEEEDEGEALDDSKARMFATASSTVPPLANRGSVPSGEMPKKKKNKKRKKKNNAQAGPTQEQEQEQEQKVEDADETGKAAAQARKGQTPGPGHQKQKQQPEQLTHQAPQHHKRAQQQGHDGAAQQQGQQRPRKRTKTRSKQKNIRRDTRPVDQRPEHLRPGHATFAGRGMTDETRKRLGFKEERTDEAEM